ncbi:hypothetical protein AHAS_Ahas02G0230800 [Arachis hypogaea]
MLLISMIFFYILSIDRFRSHKEALRNASSMEYLNSAQAIANYAAILHIMKTLNAIILQYLIMEALMVECLQHGYIESILMLPMLLWLY